MCLPLPPKKTQCIMGMGNSELLFTGLKYMHSIQSSGSSRDQITYRVTVRYRPPRIL